MALRSHQLAPNDPLLPRAYELALRAAALSGLNTDEKAAA
jgi:hypothetical protein